MPRPPRSRRSSCALALCAALLCAVPAGAYAPGKVEKRAQPALTKVKAPAGPLAAGNTQLAVTLGTCAGTLQVPAATPWKKDAGPTYSTASLVADLVLARPGASSMLHLPIAQPKPLSVNPDALSFIVDPTALPLPDSGIFKSLKGALAQAGQVAGTPISFGIASGDFISGKAPALFLEPSRSYLYFISSLPFTLLEKGGDKGGNKGGEKPASGEKDEGSKRSVVITPVFALDPCGPTVEIGGVTASVDAVSVTLAAFGVSDGQIPYQSQNGFWSGGTERIVQHQLDADSYLDGDVSLGLNDVVSLDFGGSIAVALNGSAAPKQWGAVIRGLFAKKGSRAKPAGMRVLIDGTGSLSLPLLSIPLASASVDVDSHDPARTALFFTGEHDTSVDKDGATLLQFLPQAKVLKLGESVQVFGYARLTGASGPAAVTWGVKLAGDVKLGSKDVEGDVDLSFDGHHVTMCAKLPGAERVCDLACAKDADCSGGKACFFGACAPKMPGGVPCYSDTQCVSKSCSGTCMDCKKDADCKGGQYCSTIGGAVFGFCVAKVGEGTACASQSVCKGGLHCNGRCVECTNLWSAGGDCSGGGYCDGNYSCQKKKGDAGDCSGDYQCKSGACWAGKCGAKCKHDRDCGKGEFCDVTNLCADRVKNGTACGEDDACKSGFCGPGFSCESQKSKGTACTRDAVCDSGNCSWGFCK